MSEAKKAPNILDELDKLTNPSEVGQGNKPRTKLKIVKGEKKRPLSPYFYKVSNHHELFKIGNSFYEDFKKGVKSFAITSTGYQNSQQRSILGLASFFDHQEHLKIAIISDNLYLGAFKGIIEASIPTEVELSSIEFKFEVHNFYDHFDFIDLNTIMESADTAQADFEEVLDEVLDMYDVVFWDVPELYKIQSDKEMFFPIIMRFDSLSIIVAKSATTREEVDEIRSFFLGYGISLKGLLMDSKTSASLEETTSSSKKKSWWKGFWK